MFKTNNHKSGLTGRDIDVCDTVPWMDIKLGVLSARISWWMLKISRCRS